MTKISQRMLKRARDYAVNEPSFTVAFMAWEFGVDDSAVRPAIKELLRLGIVKEIEPQSGPNAAVYAYNAEIPTNGTTPKQRRRLFAELDDSRAAGVGIEAQQTGIIVPHTRIRGTSDSPGRDRRRQASGVRLARGKGR